MRRLITIPISHYCEKARWALQRAGVEFEEDANLPGLSARLTRAAGGKATTPVLVAPEGVLAESSDIVRYADERAPEALKLVPRDPAELREHEAYEAELDGDFGPHVRRLAYALLLDRPGLLAGCVRGRVSTAQYWSFRLFRPVFIKVLVSVLRINTESAERSRSKVLAHMDRADALLADGRPNLLGDRFGLADFTFATLAAPLVLPDQHPGGMPALADCPERLRAMVGEMRERPSGRWVSKIYRGRADWANRPRP